MPWYRFIVKGESTKEGLERRFYTSRHVYAGTSAIAEAELIKILKKEFTSGVSAKVWGCGEPDIYIEECNRISSFKAMILPNRGSTFYDIDKELDSNTSGIKHISIN